jgi:hypothetical protein
VSAANGISTDLDVWGLGVVQEVDAAAMSVWIKYRNMSVDASGTAVTDLGSFNTNDIDFEDFQYVGVGGLINF